MIPIGATSPEARLRGGRCPPASPRRRGRGSWLAPRDEANADIFAKDLRSRLVVVPQISVDGFVSYPTVIAAAFGAGNVDLGVAVKHYRSGAQRGPGSG